MQSYLIAVHQNQPGETVQEVRPRAVRSPEKSRRAYESTAEPPEEKKRPAQNPGESDVFRIIIMWNRRLRRKAARKRLCRRLKPIAGKG